MKNIIAFAVLAILVSAPLMADDSVSLLENVHIGALYEGGPNILLSVIPDADLSAATPSSMLDGGDVGTDNLGRDLDDLKYYTAVKVTLVYRF